MLIWLKKCQLFNVNEVINTMDGFHRIPQPAPITGKLWNTKAVPIPTTVAILDSGVTTNIE